MQRNRTMPRPAILAADCRSGSTFLSGCLSNHPEIFWTRGEIASKRFEVKVSKTELLSFVFHQQWYSSAGVKVMLSQFTDSLVQYLSAVDGLLVILLRREDVVEQAISWEANLKTNFAHNWLRLQPPEVEVELSVCDVNSRVDLIRRRYARLTDIVSKLGAETLEVTYEQLTGGRDASEVAFEQAKRICEFLRVDFRPLYTQQRKLTQVVVKNRGYIYERLRNS